MRYIGFDMGDGESAVAAFEQGSLIEPVVLPLCGVRSLLSAVGMRSGEIVIGERAYTDALADQLSVRFKSRFTTDPASHEDVVRFVRGVLRDLINSGAFSGDDQFIVGCPAGWDAAARARYRELLLKAGVRQPQVISESRAAFLYAKYAHTVALDMDILNESALVADMGSSTLDYAYIVDGRETGIGTFGETALGGGILDAALLRTAVEASRERRQIEAVFEECRSWYSYCEIEARRVKEEYFTRLACETAPVVQKTIRICYDGVQKLMLEMNNDLAQRLTASPLPELNGQSFTQAVRHSLQNAARLTAQRPPRLLLLTGGASRMPFFRELCQESFENAVIISCPEPEFSIAKGLAYAGWVDDNLRAFREAIQKEVTPERIAVIANRAMPALLPSVAGILSDLLIDEAVLPLLEQWKRGGIRTLEQLEEQLTARMERVLASPMAQEALAPAVETWLEGLTAELQALIDPICDRYEVPRRQMKLNLTASGAGHVAVNAAGWAGLPAMGTLLGAVVTVITGLLCGGSGISLVAAGPLGFLAGAVIGAVASLLGWTALSDLLKKADLPLLLRRLPVESRLRSQQNRRDMQKKLLDAISPEDSDFRRQLSDGFSRAFSAHVYAIAQAAEIPIE
ncbi:MAG: Hsp70 family protein [Clostridia bacterium]|nr:Hsp70 family protein [Clostridia bacterium]